MKKGKETKNELFESHFEWAKNILGEISSDQVDMTPAEIRARLLNSMKMDLGDDANEKKFLEGAIFGLELASKMVENEYELTPNSKMFFVISFATLHYLHGTIAN